jgi:virulence-associated protein VapD
MPPEAILAETQGNFAINNNSISEIKVHLKSVNGNPQIRELETEIRFSQGKFSYRMDENSDFTDILKRVYGDRVKMPFGYFSKTVNIKL